MASPIYEMSQYTLKNGYFVLKQSRIWILRAIIAFAIAFSVVIPNEVSITAFQKNIFVQSGDETSPQKQSIENKIKKAIVSMYDHVDEDDAEKISKAVMSNAKEFKLEPTLILGVIAAESTFDKHAISPVGAFGLMQVLPRWHTEKIIKARNVVGTPEVFDVDTNIFVGTWILRDCMRKFNAINTALKCYNGSVGMNTNYHEKVLSKKHKFDKYI